MMPPVVVGALCRMRIGSSGIGHSPELTS